MHGGSPHANELPKIGVLKAHEQPSEHKLRAAKALDLKMLTVDYLSFQYSIGWAILRQHNVTFEKSCS